MKTLLFSGFSEITACKFTALAQTTKSTVLLITNKSLHWFRQLIAARKISKQVLVSVVLFFLLGLSCTVNASNSFEHRYSTNSDKTRVVFEFTEKVEYKYDHNNDNSQVILTVVNGSDIKRASNKTSVKWSSPHIKTVTYRRNKASKNLEVIFKLKNTPTLKVLDLLPSNTAGHRIIVDFTSSNLAQNAAIPKVKELKNDKKQLASVEHEKLLDLKNESEQALTFEPAAVSTSQNVSTVVDKLSANTQENNTVMTNETVALNKPSSSVDSELTKKLRNTVKAINNENATLFDAHNNTQQPLAKIEDMNNKDEGSEVFSTSENKTLTASDDKDTVESSEELYNALLAENTLHSHEVGKGESLYQISKKYNTTVAQLKQTNKLISNALQIGQIVLVPKPE